MNYKREIIYEGEYLNEKINGYKGKLFFEGVYKNGERNGRGKQYDLH